MDSPIVQNDARLNMACWRCDERDLHIISHAPATDWCKGQGKVIDQGAVPGTIKDTSLYHCRGPGII